MNDWLEFAKIILPLALGGSGIISVIVSCVSINVQRRKISAEALNAAAQAKLAAATAVKAAAEARGADFAADSAKIALIPKLLELVEDQAGKIMSLQEDHRRGLMREAEHKIDFTAQQAKIDDLTTRLEACESFRRVSQQHARELGAHPKEEP